MASRDLKDADGKIVGVYAVVKKSFESTFPSFELRPTCTMRSVVEQQAEFKAHRSNIDGVTTLGKHNYNPSKAIDVGIFRRRDGAYLDDLVAKGQIDREFSLALYCFVGLLAQRNGARWGGDWRNEGIPFKHNPIDPYHIELQETP